MIASSFAVGVRYGRPKGPGNNTVASGGLDEPLVPTAEPVTHTPLIKHLEPRDDEDFKLYREAGPELARSFEKKGDWAQALKIWGWIYSSGAERQERSIPLLEARLGMARAYKQKGEVAKALAAAREVHEWNDEWGVNRDYLESEAADLIRALNQKVR